MFLLSEYLKEPAAPLICNSECFRSKWGLHTASGKVANLKPDGKLLKQLSKLISLNDMFRH